MAAYRRVYDSRHLQAVCQEPGSAPEPYTRQSSMGYLYFFSIPVPLKIKYVMLKKQIQSDGYDKSPPKIFILTDLDTNIQLQYGQVQ